jgi:predicted dinucleotide-binding enzyme
MRIAVLGTGSFGSHLGLGFLRAGHDVRHGARNLDSDSVQRLRRGDPDRQIVGLQEAVTWGEVVVLATAPDSLADVARAGRDGESGFAGKVLIDTSNALDWSVRPPRMSVGRAQAEVLAELIPEARVVKAFNTLRAEHTSEARFDDGRALTFVAADDPDDRAFVMGLAEELGFEALDAGGLENAFAIEQAAALWIGIAARDGFGKRAALSVTRRSLSP